MRILKTLVGLGACSGMSILLLSSCTIVPSSSSSTQSTTSTDTAGADVIDEANSTCGLGGADCPGPKDLRQLDPEGLELSTGVIVVDVSAEDQELAESDS